MSLARHRVHVGAILDALAAYEPLEATLAAHDFTLDYHPLADLPVRITLAPPRARPHPFWNYAKNNALLLRALVLGCGCKQVAECGALDLAVDGADGAFRFHAPAHGPAAWSFTPDEAAPPAS